eukprot:1847726-Amphidinium_carterae.3
MPSQFLEDMRRLHGQAAWTNRKTRRRTELDVQEAVQALDVWLGCVKDPFQEWRRTVANRHMNLLQRTMRRDEGLTQLREELSALCTTRDFEWHPYRNSMDA